MSDFFHAEDGVLVTNLSGFVTRQQARAAGFRWVAALLMHDPAADGNSAEIRDRGSAYRAEGWRLCGWGTYGQSAPPEDDGRTAVGLCVSLGLDGWIADGEAWAEGPNRPYSWRFIVAWAEAWAKAGRTAVPLACAPLSSETGNYPRDFDYGSFTDAGAAIMPQVYGNDIPTLTVNACLMSMARVPVPQTELSLMLGTYDTGKPVPYADYQGWSGPRVIYLGDRTPADAWVKLSRAAARPGTPPREEPPMPEPPKPKPSPFSRTLRLGSRGIDVSGAKRAVYRLLKNPTKWRGYLNQSAVSQRTFGPFFRRDLILAQRLLTAGRLEGQFDEPTLRALEDANAFDDTARKLWIAGQPQQVGSSLCYPLKASGAVCQGLHPTAGVPGNWAIDFCAPAGTVVVAPEAGTVYDIHVSSNPPDSATPNPNGVYGWILYLRTADGYVYFITHFDKVTVSAGTVVAGHPLGTVGNQEPYTGRPDHCHAGVTSRLGEADAKKRITAVSLAARVSS